MKRLLLRLVVAAVMVVLAAAMAVQAFAAPPLNTGQPDVAGSTTEPGCEYFGCGGGGMANISSGNCDSQTCTETATRSGGFTQHNPEGGESGFGGRENETTTIDNTDPDNPEYTVSGSTQGGGRESGGGNCTYEYGINDPTEPIIDGAGPRCDDLVL